MTAIDDHVGVRPARPPRAPGMPADDPGLFARSSDSVGNIVVFAGVLIGELPVAFRLYRKDILRHAGALIRSNAAVILLMVFMLGTVFGLTTHYLFSSVGIESYIAAAHTIGGMRGIVEVVFGWIIAAKVGCGIVAEIGAMRITDEIDAMEVMGVRSIANLAGTRVLAGLIVFPFLWIAALSLNFIAGYLMNVLVLGTTSEGAFVYFLFLFQNPADFFFALVWGTVSALVIMTVGCYYGFSVKGGPVDVGRNTAQSMLVNLVLVSLMAMVMVQAFYGNSPNAPIGN